MKKPTSVGFFFVFNKQLALYFDSYLFILFYDCSVFFTRHLPSKRLIMHCFFDVIVYSADYYTYYSIVDGGYLTVKLLL